MNTAFDWVIAIVLWLAAAQIVLGCAISIYARLSGSSQPRSPVERKSFISLAALVLVLVSLNFFVRVAGDGDSRGVIWDTIRSAMTIDH